jgi:hypothetical protein
MLSRSEVGSSKSNSFGLEKFSTLYNTLVNANEKLLNDPLMKEKLAKPKGQGRHSPIRF